MVINYEIIALLYVITTAMAFYPLVFQLIMIEGAKWVNRGIVGQGDKRVSKDGRLFIIIPAKSEPLDLVEKSMRQALIVKPYVDGIVYILDGYDEELLRIIRLLGDKYGVRVMHREKPHGYKGGALNYVIRRVGLSDEDYVMVLDIDSSTSPETLSKLINGAGLAHALVPRWVTYNRGDSLLTLGQWIGYILFFKVLKSLSDLIEWVPILGSGSLVNVGALRMVGYWPEDVLEDVELGVKFFINGLRIAYVGDAEVYVEAPVNYYGFVRQQLRWSFGTGRVIRKYLRHILRRRHGFVVLLFLGQYFAFILQLLSILLLIVMDILGLPIPLWAFLSLIVILTPTLAIYLYVLLRLDKENGGAPFRDVFAVNSVNLAFLLALPRIAIANLMGLLGIGRFNWVPTPKGSQRWVRGRIIDLLPEIMMTLMVATAVITAILHMLWLNLLITLPYLAGYVRGLWRVLNGTL
jgi:cellulose synthase/poly-beta-1,6-N-acetylglucosamine synthase-like glycosyltransferase